MTLPIPAKRDGVFSPINLLFGRGKFSCGGSADRRAVGLRRRTSLRKLWPSRRRDGVGRQTRQSLWSASLSREMPRTSRSRSLPFLAPSRHGLSLSQSSLQSHFTPIAYEYHVLSTVYQVLHTVLNLTIAPGDCQPKNWPPIRSGQFPTRASLRTREACETKRGGGTSQGWQAFLASPCKRCACA